MCKILSNLYICMGKMMDIVDKLVMRGSALLTHRPPSTTTVPYANSLDLDEMPSNSASHPDPSCLPLRHFHQLLGDIEAL